MRSFALAAFVIRNILSKSTARWSFWSISNDFYDWTITLTFALSSCVAKEKVLFKFPTDKLKDFYRDLNNCQASCLNCHLKNKLPRDSFQLANGKIYGMNTKFLKKKYLTTFRSWKTLLMLKNEDLLRSNFLRHSILGSYFLNIANDIRKHLLK